MYVPGLCSAGGTCTALLTHTGYLSALSGLTSDLSQCVAQDQTLEHMSN